MPKTLTELLASTGIGRRKMAELVDRDASAVSLYEKKGFMPTLIAAKIASITGTKAIIVADGSVLFEDLPAAPVAAPPVPAAPATPNVAAQSVPAAPAVAAPAEQKTSAA